MVTLTFEPRIHARNNYKVSPVQDSFIESLSLMLTWPNLPQLAQLAQQRSGYGNTDWGIGLEYPVRTERADQIRFWHWTLQPGKRPKTRKYHRPERDYLGTLAGPHACSWLAERGRGGREHHAHHAGGDCLPARPL